MKSNVQISPVLQQDTNAVYGEDGRWKHCKKCKEAHSHSNICPCTKGMEAIIGTQMNPHFTIVWHNCDRRCWSACRHQQICKHLHTVGHIMIQTLYIKLLLNQLNFHKNWKITFETSNKKVTAALNVIQRELRPAITTILSTGTDDCRQVVFVHLKGRL